MTIATPHATNAHPRPAVPFQQVLLLCVPALIIGLVRRVEFLTAIPEIYYGSNSNTYFDAACAEGIARPRQWFPRQMHSTLLVYPRVAHTGSEIEAERGPYQMIYKKELK